MTRPQSDPKCAKCAALALDSPRVENGSNLQIVLHKLDYVWAGAFAVECMIKIVACGFLMTPVAAHTLCQPSTPRRSTPTALMAFAVQTSSSHHPLLLESDPRPLLSTPTSTLAGTDSIFSLSSSRCSPSSRPMISRRCECFGSCGRFACWRKMVRAGQHARARTPTMLYVPTCRALPTCRPSQHARGLCILFNAP